MYEEIDLRPYLNKLWQNWVWLIGAALLTAVVAFMGIQFIPSPYQATALLVIDDQQDLLQFDPRIQTGKEIQLRDAYPELAKSNAVVSGILERGNLNNYSLSQLQNILTAQSGDDPRILQLTVTEEDPVLAATIANAWAQELIEWATVLYGTQNGEALLYYENNLTAVEKDLQTAESDLVQFQAVNQTDIISNTLQNHFQTQSLYLTQINDLLLIEEDIAAMKIFLENSPANTTNSFSNGLTLLALQAKVFNTIDDSLALQISPDSNLSVTNKNEQIAVLDQLAEIAAEHADSLENHLAELEQEILILQQSGQEDQAKYNQLLRNLLIAEENYISLARKVSEERISTPKASPPLGLVGNAAIPEEPVNQNTLLTLIVAAFLGFSLCAAILLFHQWWQTSSLSSLKNESD